MPLPSLVLPHRPLPREDDRLGDRLGDRLVDRFLLLLGGDFDEHVLELWGLAPPFFRCCHQAPQVTFCSTEARMLGWLVQLLIRAGELRLTDTSIQGTGHQSISARVGERTCKYTYHTPRAERTLFCCANVFCLPSSFPILMSAASSLAVLAAS